MTTPIEWTNGALDDLERLRSFIEPHNATAAFGAAQTIIKATTLLADNPRLGKVVEDMADEGEYRDLEIPFGANGYMLRYRYDDSVIYILHIKHFREMSFRSPPRT